ncbi:MAG: NADP(H)-dependent aldo-keto reductase [Pseudomonadota bacterium]|nr:NADP(H)-dependent aldo-keto reductase [Gammaproteobacteria bacterium]MEC8010825.1 NADP(H)-dependent aldo-keto reductase [Pseudomonadota bacterium]HBF08067.1 NADP(H)-dependent aldo-keto reductase [Gammaproteobacteria bacterium]|tara:strand:- start:97293 stop:98339 length:1047 start_codon:yes stop_codon:yes gene_type:complete
MEYRQLGNTDEKLSIIGLGTMTWGEQNTQAEAFEQMDYALDAGVNFFDTAEMYPVPPKKETYTKTESIIGEWFKANPSKRDKVFLASKIAGPSRLGDYIRDGQLHFNRDNLEKALHASLKRLNTDYLDLYQLHWPDRNTNCFGVLGYEYPEQSQDNVPLLETLQILNEFVEQGKIKHIGLSNETPWGVMHALHQAELHNLPRVVSVQNPYNLLNRSYEVGLAEVSHRENIGLLAYSPLAFGMLTGKYRDGARPEKARLTLFDRFSRYTNPQAQLATEMYLTLADDFGVSPVDIALSYVNSRPFVASNIIGATTMEQLKQNIASVDFNLTQEMLERIQAIHQAISNPAP